MVTGNIRTSQKLISYIKHHLSSSKISFSHVTEEHILNERCLTDLVPRTTSFDIKQALETSAALHWQLFAHQTAESNSLNKETEQRKWTEYRCTVRVTSITLPLRTHNLLASDREIKALSLNLYHAS